MVRYPALQTEKRLCFERFPSPQCRLVSLTSTNGISKYTNKNNEDKIVESRKCLLSRSHISPSSNRAGEQRFISSNLPGVAIVKGCVADCTQSFFLVRPRRCQPERIVGSNSQCRAVQISRLCCAPPADITLYRDLGSWTRGEIPKLPTVKPGLLTGRYSSR